MSTTVLVLTFSFSYQRQVEFVKTIVDPVNRINKLWGTQRIKDDETYRIMRYVLQVNYLEKIFLLNIVTGHLIALNKSEEEIIKSLPHTYDIAMDQLIREHYLVPIGYDECQQVINLRNILWHLTEMRLPKEVTRFVILPTTACNARCWYCFEQGIKTSTMTEQTAKEVVNFIEVNSKKKPVSIWWFGGEPTLAEQRIDQICLGLQEKNIEYSSIISTNGYLFNSVMAEKARKLWHVSQVTISVDGVEDTYNRIKAYINPTDNPYKKVLDNIGLLLKQGIAVAVRMNYSRETYEDFPRLLQDVKQRYPDCAGLMVYPHQINQKYDEKNKIRSEQWLNQKNAELEDIACKSGMFKQKELMPSLSYQMCGAANGLYYVVTPEGNLACCAEQLSPDQIKGNIREGITNHQLVNQWHEFADNKKCFDCKLFPMCAATLKCCETNRNERCYSKDKTIKRIVETIQMKYNYT